MAFVLDASIAMQWYLADESSASADALLDRVHAEGAYVPALFRWEIENVLLMAERAHRIEPEDVDDALDSLRDLPLRVESAGDRFLSGSEVRLARHYSLTAYDAAYLSLASGLNIPLATNDNELAYAARDLGISTIS